MVKSERHSKIFRRTAWVTILAVLLQSFIPFFHHPAVAAEIGPNLHICSAINKSANTPSNKGVNPTHKLPSCPICQTLHILGNGFVSPQAYSLKTQPSKTQIVIAVPKIFIIKRLAFAAIQPRAPPVFA